MLRSFRLAVVLVTLLPSGGAYAQTVDQIVAKNLAARGGVERLKALTTAKMTGTMVQQGTTVRIMTWAKRPNMMRREMQPVPPVAPPDAAGRASVMPRNPTMMKAIMAFDGNTAWMIDPTRGNGPQPIPGPGADTAKESADFDSVLLDYKAKGLTVDLAGTEPIDGKPAYHLKITRKSGQVEHYYLDVSTGLEVRTGSTVDQGGNKVEVTTDLSDYRTVNGLTMPFAMRQAVNGETVAQITIDKWEIDVPIEDELFRMPAKR